jgi:steroid delta-isomerase-like uncharacterized protein
MKSGKPPWQLSGRSKGSILRCKELFEEGGLDMADAAAIAAELIDRVNQRDIDGFRDLLHPDFTYQGAGGPVQKGAEAGVAVVQMFTTAFPDLKLTVTGQYTDGDVSVVEFTATGTHKAELEGIPATGKSVTVQVVDVVTVRDGKAVSEREYYDQLGMMQQLGVIPSP